MGMHAALRARLLADADVAAIAGTRVTWVERPQGAGYPAVTLTTVSDLRGQHMKGFEGFRQSRVQADCWARRHIDAVALAEAVIAAAVGPFVADGVRFGRAAVEGPRGLGESTDDGYIHRQVVDLILWHGTE